MPLNTTRRTICRSSRGASANLLIASINSCGCPEGSIASLTDATGSRKLEFFYGDFCLYFQAGPAKHEVFDTLPDLFGWRCIKCPDAHAELESELSRSTDTVTVDWSRPRRGILKHLKTRPLVQPAVLESQATSLCSPFS